VLRDQEALIETERRNTALARAKANALAADDTNPWTEIGAELDKILGFPRMKFTTAGEYSVGETEIIPKGTKGTAHANDIELGFKKWEDNRLLDQRWGHVADRFIPPPEDELPDNEPHKQADGSMRRPWQFAMVLPITLLNAGGQTYAFGVTSKGGIGAVSAISRAYGKRLQEGLPGLPIVELKSDKYWHRVHHNWVHYPVLLIVGWAGPDGKPLSLAEELNDSVDF
jgi:hypothetical protein